MALARGFCVISGEDFETYRHTENITQNDGFYNVEEMVAKTYA